MAVDTMDRLLTGLAVRAHAFAVCEIDAGHRLAFAPTAAVTIHYVLVGQGALRTGGASGDQHYGPRSMIVVPARTTHSLGACDGSIEVPVSAAACGLWGDGLVRFAAGTGTPNTLVVCASVTAIYGGALGAFDALDAPLVEGCVESKALGVVFDALVGEVVDPGLGTQALVEALMKQVLVLVLRNHLNRRSVGSPLFAAWQDDRLARAIAAVIERPATAWTVEALATLAGMSRSAFAERFTHAFGHAPMAFVQRVRLQVGADLLRATDLSIAVIGASVGYRSRTYFERVFKAAHGAAPGRYRTRVRSGEATAGGAAATPKRS